MLRLPAELPEEIVNQITRILSIKPGYSLETHIHNIKIENIFEADL